MSEPAMTPIKAAADPILLPCPFCKKPPGSKVGPPAMVRCITPGCEGTKLAAYTLAEWNTRAAPAGNDGVRKQAYETARHIIGHLEGNCGLSFADVKQNDWDTLTNLIAAKARADGTFSTAPFVKDQAHRERIEKGEAVLPSYPVNTELRHYPRRTMTGGIEIVDRQFDFVRAVLPYDYRFTCNAQQWDEAERICKTLEGEMISQGIVTVAQRPMDRDEIARRISFAHLGDDREWKGFRSHADRFLAYAPPSTTRATPCDGADDLEHLDGMLDDRERGA